MTILLVHGKKDILKQLKQLVEECYPDSAVSAFSGAEEALEVIRKNGKQIDLCFAETKMQGVSGLRLIEELRRRNRQAKAVLIAQDKEFVLEGWRIGINDYLIEPLTKESIHHVRLSCK